MNDTNKSICKEIEHLSMNHKLLVTIVKKGLASKVVKATKEAGAKGGTILLGRGHGVHETRKFLGFTLDSDKEIILTIVPENLVDQILAIVDKVANLSKPSQGIGFVVDVKKVSGIAAMVQLYSKN